MSTIERFEDLIAWQKARGLTRLVYETTKRKPFAQDFGLAGQIQRAAGSVTSNIAEGFERKGQAEFHQFLTVAKGSCAETGSLLYVALDTGYIDQAPFGRLLDRTDEVARVVGGLRTAVARKRNAQRRPSGES